MKESVKKSKVRFEIWLDHSAITFAANHLVSTKQSVKNYIESLFMMKVSSRKSKVKNLLM